jgi:PleD family two-component response regulator
LLVNTVEQLWRWAHNSRFKRRRVAPWQSNPTQILIADDHPVVREGWVTILALQNDLNAVGQAHDGEETYWLYDQLCPDVLILDLRMPKKDGLEVVTERIGTRHALAETAGMDCRRERGAFRAPRRGYGRAE